MWKFPTFVFIFEFCESMDFRLLVWENKTSKDVMLETELFSDRVIRTNSQVNWAWK